MSSDFSDDDEDNTNEVNEANEVESPGENSFDDDFEDSEENKENNENKETNEKDNKSEENTSNENTDTDDNPMLGLLKNSNQNFDDANQENLLQNNPLAAHNDKEEDDDHGQQLSLGARSPSFSNLKTMIPKGSTNPVDLGDVKEKEEEKEDDHQEGQITLSVRQPSFSNLHAGQMILKGSTKALPNVDDIIAEEAENPKYVEVTNTEEGEDEFADEPVKDSDDEDEDNQAITLSVRQPSFSNLHGQLIPKGSTQAIPQVNNGDPIIVEELPNNNDQPIILNQENKMGSEILKSLHKFNHDRWKQLGYNPEESLVRRRSQIAIDPAITWKLDFRNSSCANYYPTINEVTLKDPNAKRKRPLSSRNSDDELEVEMPDNSSTVANAPSDFLAEDDLYNEKSISTDEESELPPLINSAGGRRNSSQIFDILPQSLINEKKSDQKKSQKSNVTPKSNHKKNLKAPQKTFKNNDKSNSSGSSKKNRQSPSQKIEGLDVDFHLYLDDIRVSQGYDSEQGSSRIPDRLKELIVHPKESVTYLALCGVSILGYKESTVSSVYKDLKKYLDQCVQLGYIEESMYVDGIMKKIKDEKKELEKTQTNDQVEQIDEKINQLNEQIDKMTKDHQRNLCSLESEKEVALSEIDVKMDDSLALLEEEWSSEKMQSKFNKPSPKLIEMRQTAQRLIGAHRFEEGAALAERIATLEDQESQEAAEKMNSAYQVACERVVKKYSAEKVTVEGSFNDKKASMEGIYQKQLIPLNNKLKTLQHEKEQKQMEIKRNEREERAASVARRPETRQSTTKMSGEPIAINKRLSLPPLKQVIRPMTQYKSRK